jgi:hypothetical protein
MYRVIGTDQKEYGPAGADQLRQWIAEGRINEQTLTRAEGASGWKPLSAFSEFAGIFPPPPLTRGAPPLAPMGAHLRKNSGMAVAGFVCSLLGLMCCGPFVSIPGLVFSIIGLVEINRNPTQLTGKSMAIAGIVLSAVGCLMFLATFAIGFWPGLPKGIRFHHYWHS